MHISANNPKNILLKLAFLICLIMGFPVLPVQAYTGEWVSGSDTGDYAGIYGVMGAADPNNVPGSRQYGCSWTDADGNFWLFGGQGLDIDGNIGLLNDLWKFDGTNWAWISGSDNLDQHGNYGSKGAAEASNVPGARFKANSWTDSSGNLWLFGGQGFNADSNGLLNDLWKFDGTNWMWVGGTDHVDNAGVYGTKGVGDADNLPGGRYGSTVCKDHNDNVWLFGGGAYDSAGQADLCNDLWKFNGTEWTWVSGSNLVKAAGVYGTKGAADGNNVPGARSNATAWIDSHGNLWLFGGRSYNNTNSLGFRNDLWKFDGTNWTWVSGSNDTLQRGAYGAQGVAAASNVPGARYGGAGWIDSNDNLWLLGGYGMDGGGVQSQLNDLWKFNGTNWVWIRGSQYPTAICLCVRQPRDGVYGIKGIADQDNVPSIREGGISWIDSNDMLWFFGGYSMEAGNDTFWNDLWKFDVTLAERVAMPIISPHGATSVTPVRVTITCATPGAEIHYVLNLTGAAPTRSSTLYTGPFMVSSFCNVQARAFKTGYNDSPLASNVFAVGPVISGQITLAGGTWNSGIPGVTVTASNGGGTHITDSMGNYTMHVPYNWSGSIKPTLKNYTFSPAYKMYSAVKSSMGNQNFAAYINPTVSGYVKTSGGSAISGVTMTGSGITATVTTSSTGYYALRVPYKWTGTVRPSKSYYSWSPGSRAYTAVTSSKTSQNFTGYSWPTISGYVRHPNGSAFSGVTVTASNGTKTTTSTSGYYSFRVPYNWTGTVKPIKTYYAFVPSLRSYSAVTSSKSSQNYTGNINPGGRWGGMFGVDLPFTLTLGNDFTLKGAMYLDMYEYDLPMMVLPFSGNYSFNTQTNYLVLDGKGNTEYEGVPVKYSFHAHGYMSLREAHGSFTMSMQLYQDGAWSSVLDNEPGPWNIDRP